MTSLHPLRRSPAARLIAAALLAAAAASSPAHAESRTLFVTSAVEHADLSVTLPLRQGRTASGAPVYYVILDSSDGRDAERLGVNRADKLATARRPDRATGQRAVMPVTVDADGVVVFPASVNFAGSRQVVPGPEGFPPLVAVPGATGEAGYSPLIEMPDGTVRNAPHVANATGQAAKVLSLDTRRARVRLQQTEGFHGGKAVRYVSTEASHPVAAALENVTWAPRLDAAPFAGGDGSDSSRASLAAFVNGRTGAADPQRQGLNSALLDGLDPLNVLSWNPKQGRYSPLWDVFFAAWTPRAQAAGLDRRQTDFGRVTNLAQDGWITGPDGGPFGAAGIVVNCPIISAD